MVEINVTSASITVSCYLNTIAINLKEEFCEDFLLDNHGNVLPEKTVDDGAIPFVTSAISNCQTMFACCSQKSLSVWNISDWSILGRKLINRSVSKIIFSPKNDKIIVCDKTGDVYLHSVNNFQEPGLLILGHVSMILDVLVTEDEKFIITCDRDEKIRVSHYPNGYNIENFCLGHQECVTSLNLLPHHPSILISTSGDETIKFWNYLSGKEILSHFVNIEDMEENNEKNVIVKSNVLKIDKNISLLCSLIVSFNGILIHSVEGFSSNLKCELKQCVRLQSEPLCLRISSDKKLFVLLSDLKEPLAMFNFIDNNFQKKTDNIDLNKCLCKHFNLLSSQLLFTKEKYVTSLYKKKFDNESVYLKRKMERIETLKEKKQCS